MQIVRLRPWIWAPVSGKFRHNEFLSLDCKTSSVQRIYASVNADVKGRLSKLSAHIEQIRYPFRYHNGGFDAACEFSQAF